MPHAQRAIQARVAGRNRGPCTIAEIQRTPFTVLFPRRRTPLPAAELNRSLDAIRALAAASANQLLKIVDGRQHPVVKTGERQVAAVTLRLDPT